MQELGWYLWLLFVLPLKRLSKPCKSVSLPEPQGIRTNPTCTSEDNTIAKALLTYIHAQRVFLKLH